MDRILGMYQYTGGPSSFRNWDNVAHSNCFVYIKQVSGREMKIDNGINHYPETKKSWDSRRKAYTTPFSLEFIYD